MRLGMWITPLHEPGRSVGSMLEENIEKSLLADQLGFDELWVGEHFTAARQTIPAPLIFMAALLARTKTITFGTAVINLPNHHPAIVAAEAALFDHMSKGRFMLGVGSGGVPTDFELFGLPDLPARNRMVIEAVDFIQRIWSQDPPYELEGEFWRVRVKDKLVPELGIGCLPKPFQQPGPPISLSVAAPSSPSARTAGLHGWGMISAHTVPASSVASHWVVYSEACREVGESPQGEAWRVARNVLVAPSDTEARDRVYGAQGANRYFYRYLRGSTRSRT